MSDEQLSKDDIEAMLAENFARTERLIEGFRDFTIAVLKSAGVLPEPPEDVNAPVVWEEEIGAQGGWGYHKKKLNKWAGQRVRFTAEIINPMEID